jgi:hypothetical protein
MRWLLPLLLLVAFPTQAEEATFRPEWTVRCQIGRTGFSVRFKSASGQADRDDQSITLSWGKDKGIVLPIEPALFVPIRFISDATNHCEGIGAFDWPDGRLLLLIARNDRPSDDQVVAVVIDAKTGKFVHDGGALGAIGRDVMLLRRGTGFRILLERSWHVDANDHGEFAEPDWMLLDPAGGRLVHAWEKRRE